MYQPAPSMQGLLVVCLQSELDPLPSEDAVGCDSTIPWLNASVVHRLEELKPQHVNNKQKPRASRFTPAPCSTWIDVVVRGRRKMSCCMAQNETSPEQLTISNRFLSPLNGNPHQPRSKPGASTAGMAAGNARLHITTTSPPPAAVSHIHSIPSTLMVGDFTVRRASVRSSQLGYRALPRSPPGRHRSESACSHKEVSLCEYCCSCWYQ